MDFRIEFSDEAERDLDIIFEFLAKSYLDFGESVDEAVSHAIDRTREIKISTSRLSRTPHIGNMREDIVPGLRQITINKAIYWSKVDDANKTVRIIAIYFGGQDHQNLITGRLITMGAISDQQ